MTRWLRMLLCSRYRVIGLTCIGACGWRLRKHSIGQKAPCGGYTLKIGFCEGLHNRAGFSLVVTSDDAQHPRCLQTEYVE